MNVVLSLAISGLAVFGLVLIAVIGWLADLNVLFGVVIPYAAGAIFLVGMIYRVVKWGKSPVPFRIPSTCSQQKSLPWIKYDYVDKLDNPSTKLGVWGRMILEVVFFRSLFRNTRMQFDGERIRYTSSKWLWLGAMAFHYCFLVVLIRHLRFFKEPLPFFVEVVENIDGFFQFFLPTPYQSGLLLGAAVTFLLLRRLLIPQMRYISLPADYFPLFLILTLAGTGILMRYVVKTDVITIKELTLGLVNFSPKVPEHLDVFFVIHLFLVSVLFAYFPFSKLVHLGGVFLSPTRNMANNNRAVRHINPWNPEPKYHTYEAYENDFRDLMIEAGLPVEKKAASAETE
jgi:nitrate reductase gamma subunit